MSKVTEQTINSKMEAFLQNNGFSVTSEISVQGKDGRRQVDFDLQSSGTYYGEGEWDSSYVTGYHQAIEYGDLPGASGYFVIGYPDKIADEFDQQRLSDDPDPSELLSGHEYRGMFKVHGEKPALFNGSIDEIPGWIEDALSDGAQDEDPEEYIRLMRELVDGITDYIPEADEYPSMFEHIIADMPQEESEQAAAQDAAAYLLLNQIVFYRILQDHGFPPLEREKIETPRDLQTEYFDEVLDVNYEAIFDLRVINLVPHDAVEYLRDLVEIINELQPEDFTRDLLGSVFHELIPLEVRKPVAAYYTNPMTSRLLAKLCIDDSSDHVGDLACGSGTLLMGAYEEKKEMLRGSITEEVHKEFVEKELTGLDIMPFAAHLAAVQLGLRNPGYLTDKPRIAIRDSTSVSLGDTIGSLQEQMPVGQSNLEQWNDPDSAETDQGAISSSGEGTEFELDSLDTVLMNPPFTRKQHITAEYRDILRDRFSEYSEYMHPEMGYYSFFVLLADRFLETGGKLGLVLPAVILQQQSLAGIRELLQERYRIDHIILSGYRSAFSEDTDYREILFVLSKTDSESVEEKTITKISSLEELPSRDNIERITGYLQQKTNGTDDDIISVSEVESRRFQETLDWISIVREHSSFHYDHPSRSGLSPLGEEIDSMIGGIRYNSSSDEVNQLDTMLSRERDVDVTVDWRIDNETDDHIEATSQHTAATVEVPRDILGRGLRTLSGQRTLEVANAPDKIVLDEFDGDEKFWHTDNSSKIVSDRVGHVDKRSCNLVIGGYGNLNLGGEGTSFVAVASEEPIAPTWSMWSVHTRSWKQARILSLWLNSTFSIARMVTERNEVEGTTMKWRKGDLTELAVPAVDELSEDAVAELLELYDNISEQELPKLTDQLDEHHAGRTEIDLLWANILEWDKYRTEDDVESLQSQVGGFLHQLEDIMG